ncbi:hypothetical protein M569_13415, partial [Genlisea aurea]
VKRVDRTTLVSDEYGEITAVEISDGRDFHVLNFFTLDPNSLLLPHVLQAQMVFYVHTGSGRLSWMDGEDDDAKSVDLRPGDVYGLEEGSIFYLQSYLETLQRNKLRIHAIFPHETTRRLKPYTSLRDSLMGFDRRLLQSAFRVSDEAVEELVTGSPPPEIVHGILAAKTLPEKKKKEKSLWTTAMNSKKKTAKPYNVFEEDKDFVNGNGWSTTVTARKHPVLRSSGVGLFVVNLTAGSMVGPHWNPKGSEISIVLEGHGLVSVVSSNATTATGGLRDENDRFPVEEGDVFVVPRFGPMAQMAFLDGTFVFAGFTTQASRNHPQFLAGKASVLRVFDRKVMAMAFNATLDGSAFDRIVDSQEESVILRCEDCAEEEMRAIGEMEEERRREEEAMRKREEEKRRQEEEEEEEARRREEEKWRREEEQERRREEEEEARQKEAEKRRREEEQERRREEEEEARRQEAEKRRREEEQERRREEEREAEKWRREEEQERREEEEEGERRREEEEEEETTRHGRHRYGGGSTESERAAEAQRRWEEELQREEEEAEAARRR